MRNPQLSLKDRIVIRLITAPECLDMGEFSQVDSGCGTTFCLAGLILDESGVKMAYANGVAVGLAKGEKLPSRVWIDYEVSIAAQKIGRSRVVIAARAREIWAARYGAAAAKLLPFYAVDWDMDPRNFRDVTADRVVELLQVINGVAAKVAATAA